jgi:hypothetical protein
LAKKPFAEKPPKSTREARGLPPEVDDRKPVWRLRNLDLDGPFSCRVLDATTLERVVRRLGELETMTWQEIDSGTGSHSISVARLDPAARARGAPPDD